MHFKEHSVWCSVFTLGGIGFDCMNERITSIPPICKISDESRLLRPVTGKIKMRPNESIRAKSKQDTVYYHFSLPA